MKQPAEQNSVPDKWTKAGPLEEPVTEERLDQLALETDASLATPAAMGLFAFGVGTIEIAVVLAGWVPHSAMVAAAPSLLLTAGVTQFIAGLYGLAKGNLFAGSAFGFYGANNAVVASFVLFQAVGVIGKGPADQFVLGIELACMTWITLALAVASATTYRTFMFILWSVLPAFGLSAWYDIVGGPVIIAHLGGYFFVLSSIAALYAGSAMIVNSTHRRDMWPLSKVSVKS